MSEAPTAMLTNRRSHVTLHFCVRLVVHETALKRGPIVGRKRGIYPIYRCQETGATRIFGCLDLRTKDSVLAHLFPDVPMVMGRRLEDCEQQAA